MKIKGLFAVAIAGALIQGCAAPTPLEQRNAEIAREEAARLLSAFTRGLRDKSAGDVTGLLDPTLSDKEKRKLAADIHHACWLSVYSGLQADIEKTVGAPGWRDWNRGRARLALPAVNACSDRFEVPVTLVRVAGSWYIGDLGLARPFLGAELDPPAQEKELIRARVAWVLERLRKKESGAVHYALPKEGAARMRPLPQGFLARLMRVEPKWVPIYGDLKRLEKLDIIEWPDPAEKLPLAHVSQNRLMAIYDIPYECPGGGTPGDLLRIEVTLSKTAEGWRFVGLLLCCEAIP